MAIKKFDKQEHGNNVYIEDGINFDSFIKVLFGDIPDIRMYELAESPNAYTHAYIVTKKHY